MWIDEFELADPPRPVGFTAWVAVQFGGTLQTVGWGLMLFLSPFLIALGGNVDPLAALDFRGELVGVPGTIVETRGTSFSVNEQEVFAFAYRFDYGDGVDRTGTSYAIRGMLAPGAPVTVEFQEGRPDRSRIRGMDSAPFPAWVLLFIGLFVVPGVLILWRGVRTGTRNAALMKKGRLAYATLKSKERAGYEVNERPGYHLTFEFEDADGRAHTIEHSTHLPEGLEDEKRERILYLPARPEVATLVDSLPGEGRVTPQGGFAAEGSKPLLKLILPLLNAAVYGVFGLVALLA